ncbi:hypothetical protein SUGI_0041140 [Cryptomeria japonica]|nr:hypothetical protein SUGI_0041140 [Cryptomeria japonica]
MTVMGTIYFPQWGGMLAKPSNTTEEGYYAQEWCEQDKLKGLHHNSMKFAHNSRGERGITSQEFQSQTSPFIQYT